MANLGDGFKDIFLAGVGAMAITGEKTKELVDQLIAKGELTVEQGKQINTELKYKAQEAAGTVEHDLIEARMAAMTAEERAAFAAKVTEIAAKADAAGAAQAGDASDVKVESGTSDTSDAASDAPASAAADAPKTNA